MAENNTNPLSYRSGVQKVKIVLTGLKKIKVLAGLCFFLEGLNEESFVYLLKDSCTPWFVVPSIFKASNGQLSVTHTISFSDFLFHN